MSIVIGVTAGTGVAGIVFLVLWVVYQYSPCHKTMTFRKFLREISMRT